MSEQVRSSEASPVTVHDRPLGLGGVREIPIHPGDYCGPCSLCEKDSNYGYVHLGSKPYQLDFVVFVKSKHQISEKDCICKSCMLKLNRNFSHQALAEESLQTAKKPKLECALALCNSYIQVNSNMIKKVECVSPREYVSLILKKAVSGTLDINIPDINKLALTLLIKFVSTELMQNKALLLSEMVYKFHEFFIKSETKPDQISA
ncbi:unnamed protein product [Mytilus edulis]|uniref:Uncharacterized protein n=1 Tax=Mytilus edulis TaxID=6550 RepID=A0A8S3SJJ5_MYTED|nr:unnamed protein product [Mytilus edulis]